MNENDIAKRVAEFVKEGWTLTAYNCPICNSPIISKKDEYFCPVCNKKVIIAKDEKEAWSAIRSSIIDMLERKIVNKINNIVSSDTLDENLEVLLTYLKILKEIRDLKS